jgi:hypothetical protein
VLKRRGLVSLIILVILIIPTRVTDRGIAVNKLYL